MPNKFKKTRARLLRRLTYKYRLRILNESTFEEVASFRLSQMNVFVFLGILSIGLVILTTYIIAFTPLREYIPGYANVQVTRDLVNLNVKTDSLQEQMLYKDYYIQNIRNIIQGKPPVSSFKVYKDSSRNYRRIDNIRSAEDSLLRRDVENAERYDLQATSTTGKTGLLLYPPLRGKILEKFNPRESVYGIRMLTTAGEPVKAVMDGVVIVSEWTPDNEYMLIVDHSGNYVSVYKNAAVNLRKAGDRVEAGDALAIAPGSEGGSLREHFLFELWYQGKPVNPEEYILF